MLITPDSTHTLTHTRRHSQADTKKKVRLQFEDKFRLAESAPQRERNGTGDTPYLWWVLGIWYSVFGIRYLVFSILGA